MDNFLTLLYFELFKNREREKKLISNNIWSSDPDGHDKNIMNDQQITEVREIDKMLCNLIKEYTHINLLK